MRSTNDWPRSAQSGAARDDRFEELRLAYYARLRSDRARVRALRTELDSTQETVPTYEAIRLCAHGMAGAAAIFEAKDIMQAARKLEHAAGHAAQTQASGAKSGVRPSLDALMELLNTLCD